MNINKNDSFKRFNFISLILSLGFVLFFLIFAVLAQYIVLIFFSGFNSQELKNSIIFFISQVLTFFTVLYIFLVKRNDSISMSESRYSITKLILIGILFGIFTFIMNIISLSIYSFIFGSVVRSQNTEVINQITVKYPYLLIITVIVGPIIEEITFKAGIFTFFHEIFKDNNNFLKVFMPALISACIFGLLHDGLKLLPVYIVPSFLGCIIYKKFNSLIPCIVAHFLNNLTVMIIVFYSIS